MSQARLFIPARVEALPRQLKERILRTRSLFAIAQMQRVSKNWRAFIQGTFADELKLLKRAVHERPSRLDCRRGTTDAFSAAVRFDGVEQLLIDCSRLSVSGLALLAPKFSVGTMREITLENLKLGAAGAALDFKFSNQLNTLLIRQAGLDPVHMARLAMAVPRAIQRVAVSPGIPVLSFAGCAQLDNAKLVAFRDCFHVGLEALDLSGCAGLGSDVIEFLCGTLPAHHLPSRQLRLSGTKFSQPQLLRLIKRLPAGLEGIDLGGYDLGVGVLISALKRFENLRDIGVGQCTRLSVADLRLLLRPYTRLRSLGCGGICKNVEDVASLLSVLPSSLEVLDLAGTTALDTEGFQLIVDQVSSGRFARMEAVQVAGCEIHKIELKGVDHQQLRALTADLPGRLTHFDLVDGHVGEAALQDLVDRLVRHNRLMHLSIDDRTFNDDHLLSLRPLIGRLVLFGLCSRAVQGPGLEVLRAATNLRALLIRRSSLDQRAVEHLAQMPFWGRLGSLVVDDSLGIDLARLLLQLPPRLQELSLQGYGQELAEGEFKLPSSLRTLDISRSNGLSRTVLRSLFRRLPQLGHLRASGTRIDDEAVEALLANHRVPIKEIDLTACELITGASVGALMGRLANEPKQVRFTRCSAVKVLDFSVLPAVRIGQLRALTDHPLPPNLIALNLSGCRGLTDELLLDLLLAAGRLRSLKINQCQGLTAEGLARLRPYLPDSLRALEMADTFCDDEVAEELFPKLPANLEAFDVSRCARLTNLAPLASKASPDSLRVFKVDECIGIKELSLAGMRGMKDQDLVRLIGNLPCSVEVLDLSHLEQITDRLISKLTLPTSLRKLILAGCPKLTERGIGPIVEQVANFDRFEYLDLSGCPIGRPIANLPRGLKTLRLKGCSGLQLDQMATLLPKTLQFLSISSPGRAACDALVKARLPQLSGLDLSGSPDLEDDHLLRLLRQLLTPIVDLDVSDCPRLTARGLVQVVSSLTDAKRLNFAGTAVDDAAFARIATQLHEDLEELSLAGCQVGRKAIKRLCRKKRSALRVLDLKGCEDIVWADLQPLLDQDLPQLRRLDLRGTGIVSVTLGHQPAVKDRLLKALLLPDAVWQIDASGADQIGARGWGHFKLPKQCTRLILKDCASLDDRACGVLVRQVAQKLEFLDLSGTEVTGRTLGSLPVLYDLNLSGCAKLSDTLVRALKGKTAQLVRLNLADCPRLTPDELDRLLKEPFPELLELDLSRTVTDGLHTIPPSLERLLLAGCQQLDPQRLGALAASYRGFLDLTEANVPFERLLQLKAILDRQLTCSPPPPPPQVAIDAAWFDDRAGLALADWLGEGTENLTLKLEKPLSVAAIDAVVEKLPMTLKQLTLCNVGTVRSVRLKSAIPRTLEQLHLEHTGVDVPSLFEKPFDQLRQLTIVDEQMKDASLIDIADQWPASLTSLSLRCPQLTECGVGAIADRLSRCVNLDLSTSACGDEIFTLLARHFPALLRVKLDACQQLRGRDLQNLGKLTQLSLVACGGIEVEYLLAAAVELGPEVINYRFEGAIVPLTDADWLSDRHLECLANWLGDGITEITLKNTPVGDRGVAALARLLPHSVELLDLSGTKVADRGIEALAPCLPANLQQLLLWNTAIGDGALAAIGRAQPAGLIHLEVGRTQVTGKGLDALAETFPPALRSLGLAHLQADLRPATSFCARMNSPMQRLDLGGTEWPTSWVRQLEESKTRIDILSLDGSPNLANRMLVTYLPQLIGQVGRLELGRASIHPHLVRQLSEGGMEVEWSMPCRLIHPRWCRTADDLTVLIDNLPRDIEWCVPTNSVLTQVTAAQWQILEKLAQQEVPWAIDTLGRLGEMLFPPDVGAPHDSKQCYQLAIDMGYAPALYHLALLETDRTAKLGLLKRAQSAGFALAFCEEVHLLGDGPEDRERRRFCCAKAVQMGEPRGLYLESVLIDHNWNGYAPKIKRAGRLLYPPAWGEGPCINTAVYLGSVDAQRVMLKKLLAAKGSEQAQLLAEAQINLATYLAPLGDLNAIRCLGRHFVKRAGREKMLGFWYLATAAGLGKAPDQYEYGSHLFREKRWAEGLEPLQKAADQDHAAAIILLAWYWAAEERFDQNAKTAISYLERAADLKHAKSQYLLGRCYLRDRGVAKDLQRAAELFGLAASQGHLAAQLAIGRMYRHGEGVKQDLAKAELYLQMAADQGNPKAYYKLAICLEQQENYVAANIYCQLAADAGLEKAQCHYAKMVRQKDPAEAMRYYELAMKQGSSEACFKLGLFHESGEVVKQSYRQALKFYEQAAQAGNLEATERLALSLSRQKLNCYDMAAAVHYWLMAVKQGSTEALYYLGDSHYRGNGVGRCLETAFDYYLRHARAGGKRAFFNLGRCCEQGKGTDRDIRQAIYWYVRDLEVCDQARGQTFYHLGCCYRRLGTEQALAFKHFSLAAAEKSPPEGTFCALGKCYYHGWGSKKNEQKAFDCFKIAVERHENPEALEYMARFYLGEPSGIVDRDVAAAYNCLDRSVKKGCAAGQFGMAKLLQSDEPLITRNLPRAFDLLEKAAERGYPAASYELGRRCAAGLGVGKDEAKAFTLFKAAADRSHGRAQLAVARCYQYGRGVKRDMNWAVAYFEKACQMSMVDAALQLAYWRDKGRWLEKDEDEAIRLYQKAVELGSAEAEFVLAEAYIQGRGGLDVDLRKAIDLLSSARSRCHQRAVIRLAQLLDDSRWPAIYDPQQATLYFKEAADRGDSRSCLRYARRAELSGRVSQAVLYYLRAAADLPEASRRVGAIYAWGRGDVEPDPKRGFKLLQRAAEKGDREGYYLLGRCYVEGNGTQQSWEEAVSSFQKAGNHMSAKAAIGRCYLKGLGVPKDFVLARLHLQEAAKANIGESLHDLALCYRHGIGGLATDLKKAHQLYLQAAKKGQLEAMLNVAASFRYGTGVRINLKQAMNWYLLAAFEGSPVGQYNAGICYLEGIGTDSSPVQGVAMLLSAAKAGSGIAQYHLALCYHHGRGVEADIARAVTWYKKAADEGLLLAKTALKAIAHLVTPAET